MERGFDTLRRRARLRGYEKTGGSYLRAKRGLRLEKIAYIVTVKRP
jgi:hypothetical protein